MHPLSLGCGSPPLQPPVPGTPARQSGVSQVSAHCQERGESERKREREGQNKNERERERESLHSLPHKRAGTTACNCLPTACWLDTYTSSIQSYLNTASLDPYSIVQLWILQLFGYKNGGGINLRVMQRAGIPIRGLAEAALPGGVAGICLAV